MNQLNKILKSFHKTLAQLTELAETNRRTATVKEEAANRLHDEADALLEEAAAALNAADRLRDLIGAE